jgi:hypothetical protein
MYNSAQFLEELQSQGLRIIEPDKQIGGNSKLYKFRLQGKKYALKVYTGNNERITRSRNREISAIQFLRNSKYYHVPKIDIDLSPVDGLCMEFLPGKNPRQSKNINKLILNTLRDLKSLYQLDSSFVNAVDASFESSDVIKQIESRLQGDDIWNLREMQAIFAKLKSVENVKFPISSFTYSFSDIGSHNMIVFLRKHWFIDLEFFGRDSAVKMIADYLLHPKNVFEEKMIIECTRIAEREFGVDTELLMKSVPFFAAKWATIVARRLTLTTPKKPNPIIAKRVSNYLQLAALTDITSIRKKLLDLR